MNKRNQLGQRLNNENQGKTPHCKFKIETLLIAGESKEAPVPGNRRSPPGGGVQ